MNYTYVSGIYKIVNLLNNNIYIGSAINITARKANHFKNLRDNKHCNTHLQRAYNKYGKENFKFIIIEILEDKKTLIIREQYYIDLLTPQYNILKIAGSSLGYKQDKKVRDKISLTFKKRRDAFTKEFVNHYLLGYSMSTLSKIYNTSTWRLSKILNENNIQKYKISEYHKIPVYQYSINNELIKEWEYCSQAAEVLNIDKSGICKCANNKIKTHKGYIWKYKKI